MTIKQQGGIFGRNPTYNDVTVDGSISVDTISEKTSGSGVTIDGFQAIDGGAVASANSPKIDLSSANANGYNYRFQSSNSGFFTLSQQDGSVLTGDGSLLRYNTSGYFDIYQNLAFANGKGIDFSATSGTGTSELFDDYEEGTFTATLTGTTAAPTTPVTATARYVKVGKLVTVNINMVNKNTTGATGKMQITGLPFTAQSGSVNTGSPLMFGFNVTNKSAVTLIGSASSTITFYSVADNGPWTQEDISAGTTKYLYMSMTYQAA